jgi:hypothetical protein
MATPPRSGPVRPIAPRSSLTALDAAHPIDDPETRADIRAWTRLILGRSGSGTVTVTMDFHEGRYQGLRVGGQTGRKLATKGR